MRSLRQPEEGLPGGKSFQASYSLAPLVDITRRQRQRSENGPKPVDRFFVPLFSRIAEV